MTSSSLLSDWKPEVARWYPCFVVFQLDASGNSMESCGRHPVFVYHSTCLKQCKLVDWMYDQRWSWRTWTVSLLQCSLFIVHSTTWSVNDARKGVHPLITKSVWLRNKLWALKQFTKRSGELFGCRRTTAGQISATRSVGLIMDRSPNGFCQQGQGCTECMPRQDIHVRVLVRRRVSHSPLWRTYTFLYHGSFSIYISIFRFWINGVISWRNQESVDRPLCPGLTSSNLISVSTTFFVDVECCRFGFGRIRLSYSSSVNSFYVKTMMLQHGGLWRKSFENLKYEYGISDGKQRSGRYVLRLERSVDQVFCLFWVCESTSFLPEIGVSSFSWRLDQSKLLLNTPVSTVIVTNQAFCSIGWSVKATWSGCQKCPRQKAAKTIGAEVTDEGPAKSATLHIQYVFHMPLNYIITAWNQLWSLARIQVPINEVFLFNFG